jgi:hypothetical protein
MQRKSPLRNKRDEREYRAKAGTTLSALVAAKSR